MTATDNKALASRVYEAINTQDLAALDELFDPHIIRHAMGEVGIERARAAVTNAFHSASSVAAIAHHCPSHHHP
ncbi:MAG: hypothetical protein IMW89_15635 [Ktedonobacteraceae bacterium]|nr:hypothetical protein [Ktedonobacteraceae bacterium]